MHIFIMILLISLLIIVHEFGHYITAKIFGVRVVKFAIGLPLGPTLYKKQLGETEFLIHAFLFGGYVSFLDDETEKKQENKSDNVDIEDIPLDSPLRFKNKKDWQKAIVFVAGVFANFVFAIFLIMLTASIYHKLPTGLAEVYIAKVQKTDNASNIVKADVKENDKIFKINGIEIEASSQVLFMVNKSRFYDGFVSQKIIDKKFQDLKNLNGNKVNADDFLKKGTNLILPKQTPEEPLQINADVAKGWEKFKTDEIELTQDIKNLRDKLKNKKSFTVDEDNKYTSQMIAQALSDSYKPLNITLLREGREIELNNIYTNEKGLLGVALAVKENFMPTNTFGEIVVNSWKYTVDNLKLMFFGLKQIFTGKIDASEMHGIVLIAKVGGDIIEQNGILDGLLLTAVISLNLAIINLLPIPALDGGHLLFLIIEKLCGRKLSEDKIEKISNIFFFLLLALMVLILFNDVYALVIKKF